MVVGVMTGLPLVLIYLICWCWALSLFTKLLILMPGLGLTLRFVITIVVRDLALGCCGHGNCLSWMSLRLASVI